MRYFGNGNWARKIVGWNDVRVSEETLECRLNGLVYTCEVDHSGITGRSTMQ